MTRDEERAIRRCIDSAAKFVDEILVLDTGSKDHTVSIANSVGATVVHRQWNDDFAASRNFGLSKIRTDYVLSLDADEWLVRGHEILNTIRQSNAQRSVFEVGMYMGPSDGDEAYTSDITSTFWTPRLFPKELSYRGRIHEVLCHSLPIQRTSLIVMHDGYEPAQLKRKAGRNLALIEKSLAEAASNPLMQYYYAKELLIALELTDISPDRLELIKIADHFLEAIARLSPKAANRELVIREALLFFRRYKLFELGIRLIFNAVRDDDLSRELSFLSAVFLYECVLTEIPIKKDVLLAAADSILFRVLHAVDKTSSTYAFKIEIGSVLNLRAAATARCVDASRPISDVAQE